MRIIDIEALVDERAVAHLLNVSLASVRNWRCDPRGRGPKFLKIGSSVRYRPEDLRDYIQSLSATRRAA